MKRINRVPILLLCTVALILAACTPQTGPSPEDPVENPPTAGNPTGSSSGSSDLPPQAAIAAQQWLAGEIGKPVDQVAFLNAERVDWMDSCLGLGQPNEACGEMVVSGWRVTLRVDGQEYEVRTDLAGSVLRSPQVTAKPGTDTGDPLANTRWMLVSFREGEVETPAIAGSAPTLEFQPGGRAGGSAGCNSFGGTFTAQDGEIHFGDLMSTLMMCVDENVMEHETKYLQALQNASGYELKDGQLILQYNAGQGILTFEAEAPQG